MLTVRLVRWLLRGLVRPETLHVSLRAGVLTISSLEVRSPVLTALLALAGLSLRHCAVQTVQLALPWADSLPSGERVRLEGVSVVLAPSARQRERTPAREPRPPRGDVGEAPRLEAVERLRRFETAQSGKHALAVLFTRVLGKMCVIVSNVRVVLLQSAPKDGASLTGGASVGGRVALELRLDELRYSQAAEPTEATLAAAPHRKLLTLRSASVALLSLPNSSAPSAAPSAEPSATPPPAAAAEPPPPRGVATRRLAAWLASSLRRTQEECEAEESAGVYDDAAEESGEESGSDSEASQYVDFSSDGADSSCEEAEEAAMGRARERVAAARAAAAAELEEREVRKLLDATAEEMHGQQRVEIARLACSTAEKDQHALQESALSPAALPPAAWITLTLSLPEADPSAVAAAHSPPPRSRRTPRVQSDFEELRYLAAGLEREAAHEGEDGLRVGEVRVVAADMAIGAVQVLLTPEQIGQLAGLASSFAAVDVEPQSLAPPPAADAPPAAPLATRGNGRLQAAIAAVAELMSSLKEERPAESIPSRAAAAEGGLPVLSLRVREVTLGVACGEAAGTPSESSDDELACSALSEAGAASGFWGEAAAATHAEGRHGCVLFACARQLEVFDVAARPAADNASLASSCSDMGSSWGDLGGGAADAGGAVRFRFASLQLSEHLALAPLAPPLADAPRLDAPAARQCAELLRGGLCFASPPPPLLPSAALFSLLPPRADGGASLSSSRTADAWAVDLLVTLLPHAAAIDATVGAAAAVLPAGAPERLAARLSRARPPHRPPPPHRTAPPHRARGELWRGVRLALRGEGAELWWLDAAAAFDATSRSLGVRLAAQRPELELESSAGDVAVASQSIALWLLRSAASEADASAAALRWMRRKGAPSSLPLPRAPLAIVWGPGAGCTARFAPSRGATPALHFPQLAVCLTPTDVQQLIHISSASPPTSPSPPPAAADTRGEQQTSVGAASLLLLMPRAAADPVQWELSLCGVALFTRPAAPLTTFDDEHAAASPSASASASAPTAASWPPPADRATLRLSSRGASFSRVGGDEGEAHSFVSMLLRREWTTPQWRDPPPLDEARDELIIVEVHSSSVSIILSELAIDHTLFPAAADELPLFFESTPPRAPAAPAARPAWHFFAHLHSSLLFYSPSPPLAPREEDDEPPHPQAVALIHSLSLSTLPSASASAAAAPPPASTLEVNVHLAELLLSTPAAPRRASRPASRLSSARADPLAPPRDGLASQGFVSVARLDGLCVASHAQLPDAAAAATDEPPTALCVTNDELHIKTCSASTKALIELIGSLTQACASPSGAPPPPPPAAAAPPPLAPYHSSPSAAPPFACIGCLASETPLGARDAAAAPPPTDLTAHLIESYHADPAGPPPPPLPSPAGGGALPAGWERRLDLRTGRQFYYDLLNDAVAWELPTARAAPRESPPPPDAPPPAAPPPDAPPPAAPSVQPEQRARWLNDSGAPTLIDDHIKSTQGSEFDEAAEEARRWGCIVLKHAVARLKLRWTILASPSADEPALELLADGVTLSLAQFAAPPHAAARPLACDWQLKFRLAHFEVLDGVRDAPAGASAARRGWRRLVAQDRGGEQPRSHDAFVCASLSQHEGELRALLQLQPVRLVVAHASLNFLRTFLNELAAADLAEDPEAPTRAAAAERHPEGEQRSYFQKFEVRPVHLRVDFLPKLPSLSDLLQPSAASVAQLLPVHNVSISLGALRLGGQASWGQLADSALAEWVPQLLMQWRSYVTSIAPLSSVAHITSAAKQLLLAPVRHAPLRGISLGSDAFARAVGAEALYLTSRAVSVLHMMIEQVDHLAAGTSAHYPESAVRASLTHLAVASDMAMDMRNKIDKQRALDDADTSVWR